MSNLKCTCYPEDIQIPLDDLRVDIQRRTLMERPEILLKYGDHVFQIQTPDGEFSARCRMFAHETLQDSYDVCYPWVCKQYTDDLRRSCKRCVDE